ncbi:uncharacterized protein LOC136089252 isoform X2 [Hydra vulgaris]|uniref:Uncharacterized protein LOC136089252 isoform X2 n=1 Tax=Hydra vulgaris TaxID=6087 RepID=A0ABM4D9Y6_HYDVU
MPLCINKLFNEKMSLQSVFYLAASLNIMCSIDTGLQSNLAGVIQNVGLGTQNITTKDLVSNLTGVIETVFSVISNLNQSVSIQHTSLNTTLDIFNKIKEIFSNLNHSVSVQLSNVNTTLDILNKIKEVGQQVEWNDFCPDIYWTTSIGSETNLVVCKSRAISSNEWEKCISFCEEMGKIRTLQYCHFLADITGNVVAPLCFSGDSLLYNKKIVVQNDTLLSTLNVLYDEFIISFDLYCNASISHITVMILTYNLFDDIIEFNFFENYFQIIFENGNNKSFILKKNSWSAVQVKQYYNGSYFTTISVDGTDVILDYITKPKVYFNIDVWIRFQNEYFALKNIFIVSKTRGWSSWSECSATCGNGYRTKISLRAISYGETKTASCNLISCEEWSAWSECSATCGNGYRTKISLAAITNGETKTESCNLISCPEDGMWGSWSKSECSTSCGWGGKVSFKRICDNPQPKYTGRPCMGVNNYTDDCQYDITCPVNGIWSKWSAWSFCNKPCEGGFMSRYRTCFIPKYGGQSCNGSSIQTTDCPNQTCINIGLNVNIYLPDEPYQPHYSTLHHPGSVDLKNNIAKAIANLYKNSKTNVTYNIELNSMTNGDP